MLIRCKNQTLLEAGCDEAGRGCLAGPVFAAAVILPNDFECELLNDSKQLTEKNRYLLRPLILSRAISWAIGVVTPGEIDQINILNASFLAMNRAVSKLALKPEFLLIDGNRFRNINQMPINQLKLDKAETEALKTLIEIPFGCEIKGDGKFMNIAAASVLAKTYRDDFMQELHKEYPLYQWNKNKGYPTTTHRDAIRAYGLSPHHRLSFKQLENQLAIEI